MAKRPELLLLDEPVASLDPLARREFLQDLMEAVAEQELSVVLSSHLVSDVERACDYLVVLVDSRVQVAGDIDELLASHHRLTGPRRDVVDAAGRPAGDDSQPHRPAVDLHRPHRASDPRPRLGGQPAHARGPGHRLHGPAAPTANRRPTEPWRCSDDLADLAAVPRSALAVLGALGRGAWRSPSPGPQLADLLRAAGEDFFDRLCTEGAKRRSSTSASALGYAVPASSASFWGTPLVARELEAGTHRLVWNQSITRTRWLSTKLGDRGPRRPRRGLIGLAMTWWAPRWTTRLLSGLTDSGPFSVPRIWPDFFGSRGLVPIGMAVLALAIGVAWGISSGGRWRPWR